ncbi:MAG: hypothetical protein OXF89_13745 [Rhodospirillaceae bacterium]|nr:hypothetical protein [Rhodospirillaceae bacterium]
MLAHDLQQVDDLAVDVVDQLALRPPAAAKERAGHAAEGLGVAVVRRRLDARDQALR